MIVPVFLGHLILLIFPIAISVFLLWLCFHKWKWNERLLVLVLLPGGFMYLVTWVACTSDIVLLEQDLSVKRSMLFFSSDYEAPDGQKLKLEKSGSNDVFIVNASDVCLAIENISYGKSFLFIDFGPEILPPHRTVMERNVPDYFPDEQPPGSVSVQKGMDRDSRDWLRQASEEEFRNMKDSSDLVPVR